MTVAPHSDNIALLARIQALRARTTDRGCTPQEAVAAAAKAAELLERHGLSLADLERHASPCDRAEVRTDRSRAGPLDACGPSVAAYAECCFWLEVTVGDRLTQVFFGLPADVQTALRMMARIGREIEAEGNAFRSGREYKQGRGGRRRELHTSFMLGLVEGVQAKLGMMCAAREAALQSSGSGSHPLLRTSVVDAEVARLGLRFRSPKPVERSLNPGAYDAGRIAGHRVELVGGIEGKVNEWSP